MVDRALAKAPAERFLSAIEFQNALRSYKDLEEESPVKLVPIVLNEPTDDDSDGVVVFKRVDVGGGESAELAGGDDPDQTPIYARTELPTIEDELTQIDPAPARRNPLPPAAAARLRRRVRRDSGPRQRAPSA